MSHVAIVLAAGQGTRMKSGIPKVLHRVAGRPMLAWVLDAVTATKPERVIVVVGHGAESVTAILPDGVEWCVQEERRGTGHATQIALEHAGDVAGRSVMVLPGDTPLITAEALGDLLHHHTLPGAAMLAAEVEDPNGYGRVLRSGGVVTGIVEHKDASDDQRRVREINAGMYVFDGTTLPADLAALRPENAQAELYVTDVIGAVADRGEPISALVVAEHLVVGINTHEQLAEANRIARRRILTGLMVSGVSILDPDRTYVDAGVVVEPGAVIYPGCHLEGATHISAGAVVGPDVYAVDTAIGSGARAWYSVLRGADIGPDCEVGPYTTLRPGTVMRSGSKAGSFVEIKKSVLGENAKVPHLSYMGDATIGANANIGAGSITCNYDGHNKNETHIGEGAFIGSDTMLVAPVSIGDGAITGAGSVITRDVESGSLAVERSEQRSVPGYAARRAERYRGGEGETKEH